MQAGHFMLYLARDTWLHAQELHEEADDAAEDGLCITCGGGGGAGNPVLLCDVCSRWVHGGPCPTGASASAARSTSCSIVIFLAPCPSVRSRTAHRAMRPAARSSTQHAKLT